MTRTQKEENNMPAGKPYPKYLMVFIIVLALPATIFAEKTAPCRKQALTVINGVEIWSVPDEDAFFFRTEGMKIDADGSPNAYHPDNIGLDYLENGGEPGNWWAVVTDNGNPDGTPIIQGPSDPSPGYYVSKTTLEDRTKAITDPTRYVDSEKIPYIVLPRGMEGGAKPGDFAVVVNTANHRKVYAIFADTGPSEKIGEGSIALAKALGVPSDPKTGGSYDKIVCLVFPGSGNLEPRSHREIESSGSALFKDWGGLDRVKTCFPDYGGGKPVIGMEAECQYKEEDGGFRIKLNLNVGCEYDEILREDIRRFVTVKELADYTVENSYSARSIYIRGEFEPETTYTVTVDGAICKLGGLSTTKTVTTGKYPSAVRFVGKGLYFSAGNPYLRFQYIGKQTQIDWTIYHIEKKLRHLFRTTENINRNPEQIGLRDTTRYDLISVRYLKDYPLKKYRVSTKVEPAEKWKTGSVSLWQYCRPGDWLLVTANDNKVSKLVQFSNLGFYIRRNAKGLRGRAIALDSGEPVADAGVRVIDKKNELKAQLKTGPDGGFFISPEHAAFDEIGRVEVSKGEDTVEIYFDNKGIPLEKKSFNVSGYSKTGAYHAYAYSDRGLYRLEDTVHITAVIRDEELGVPVIDPELKIIGPKGLIKRISFTQDELENGALSWSWKIPQDASTGNYQAEVLYGGRELAVAAFSVEQIVPARLEAKLKFDEPFVSRLPETEEKVAASGKIESGFLFGAPASELGWEYRCVLESTRFLPAEYPGYVFGGESEGFQPAAFFQEKELELGPDGTSEFACDCEKMPENLPSVGKISAVATVFEDGGRYVESVASVPFYTVSAVPGIKPGFSGRLNRGENASFQIVALDPVTKQAKPGVSLKIDLFQKESLAWFYGHKPDEKKIDSKMSRKLYSTKNVVSGEDPFEFSFAPPAPGEWEIEVSADGTDVKSRVAFQYDAWRIKASDMLSKVVRFIPDKKKYIVGETAKIYIAAPFDGKLIVHHEKDGEVLVSETIDVANKSAEYGFEVTEKHAPWFYMTGILLRTSENTKIVHKSPRETPYRAIGLEPIQAVNPDGVLTFDIQTPPTARPESSLPLVVRTLNGKGEKMPGEHRLTVAVVDEGILQLRGYAVPNPYPAFHKKPAYADEWFDTFGKVVPYSLHKGESVFGGDSGIPKVKARRIKPMAWWSGIVKTDAQGEIRLDVPVGDYSGKVRIMVVGWSNGKFGSSFKNSRIFAPVDLFASLPRVVGAFDQSTVAVEIFNNTDADKEIRAEFEVKGPLQFEGTGKSLKIGAKSSETIYVDLKGTGVPGDGVFTVRVLDGQDAVRTRTTEIHVRPGGVPIDISHAFSLKGTESRSFEIPDRLKNPAGPANWQVLVSDSPVARISDQLRMLVSYPHGCAEQTASRTFAMLLIRPALGERALQRYMPGKSKDIDHFVREGIAKLGRMQMADGGFAFWEDGDTSHPWLNVFVTHLLWKAKTLSQDVPEEMYEKALEKLKQQFTSDAPGDTVAYCALILAQNGQLPKSDLQLLISGDGGAQENPGEGGATANAFARAAMRVMGQDAEDAGGGTGGNSFLDADSSRALTLYAESIESGDEKLYEKLVALVSSLENRHCSTHTIAWALIAAESICSAKAPAKIKLAMPGKPDIVLTSGRDANLAVGDLGSSVKGPFILENLSKDPNAVVYGHINFHGWPEKPPEKGYQNGIAVKKWYVDKDGGIMVPPFSASQGERYFVALSVGLADDAVRDEIPNIVIEDWLPAGFEIENPRLLKKEALPALPPDLKDCALWEPDHVDYLDDKVAVFGTLNKTQKTFIYRIRAITPGEYQAMGTRGEAMYMPSVRAWSIVDEKITVIRNSRDVAKE